MLIVSPEHLPENLEEETLTDEMEEVIFQINPYAKWNVETLKAQQENDPDISLILNAYKENRKPSEKEAKSFSTTSRLYYSQWDSLQMDENNLLRTEIEVRTTPFIEKRQVLILPRKMVREVVMGAHEQMAHRASLETYKKVRLYCYFPAMLKTV